MAFVLVKDEEPVDETPKSRFVLEEEKPKSLGQKGAEAILNTIGPGTDVAKGLTRGGVGFLGSLVDLASAVGPYVGGAGTYKPTSPEERESFQKAYGSEGLKEKLGQLGVTAPETALGRLGERLGGYGPFAMTPAALVGAGAGQLAEELGAPGGVQLLAELLAPNAKALGRGVAAVPRAIKEFAKAKPSTYASGLEKPLAAEAPGFFTRMAKQLPESLQGSLENLTTQADALLEKIKQKVPGFAKFAEGFDFEDYHNKIFDEVGEIAKNYETPLNTNNIYNFLSQTREKLLKMNFTTPGIEKVLKKVNTLISKQQKNAIKEANVFYKKNYGRKPTQKEIKQFSSNPKNKLIDLYNDFRNINRELKDILLTKSSRGAMGEYKKFLDAYKQQIIGAFDSNLGPKNKFNNLFKTSNKSYTEYQNILSLEKLLSPITGGKFGFADWAKLAKNKNLPLLEKIVGKDIAGEINLLSRDVLDAQKSLKSVKAKDFLTSASEAGLLKYVFSFIGQKLGGVKLVGDVVRYGMGSLLTKPSRIKNFREAMKSAKKLDFAGFKTAMMPIIRGIESEEESED